MPPFMLFDEPTSGINPEMIKEVLGTMIELTEEDITHTLCDPRVELRPSGGEPGVIFDVGQRHAMSDHLDNETPAATKSGA